MPILNQLSKAITIIVFFMVSLPGVAQNVVSQHIKDQQLKKNVRPVRDALYLVQQLQPKIFEYNNDLYAKLRFPGGKQYGFLAEEVQQVLPELVTTKTQAYGAGKNSTKSISYKNYDLESLIPLLVGAIQEQQAEIEALKRELAAKKH